MIRLLNLAAVGALTLSIASAPPVRADSITTDDAFLPAARITGATGRFRTDVSIFNPDTNTKARVKIYFTRADTNGLSVPGIQIDPDLEPRETVVLKDILGEYFDVTSDYGVVEVLSSIPVMVTSNTYNIDGPNGGTYSQYSPGQPYRNALPFDDSIFGDLYVTGIPNDAVHRTNAAIINPTEVPLEAGVELVTAGGTKLGSRTYTIPALSMTQLNDIFGATFASTRPPAGGGYRLNFFVNLKNGARILCYATVTDTRTGAPYLIPGQAVRP